MKILKLGNVINTENGVTTAYKKATGNTLTDTFIQCKTDLPETVGNSNAYIEYANEIKSAIAHIEPRTLQSNKAQLVFIAKAMAARDVRFYLNSLAIYPDGSIAATDGHRMHYRRESKNSFLATPIILPAAVIKLLLRVMSVKSVVTFKAFAHRITIQCDEYTIISKLIDGKYPAVERVIPDSTKPMHAFTLSKKLLKDSVRPLANSEYKGVRLNMRDKCIEVNNEAKEEHVFKAAIGCNDIDMDPIGFNIDYLVDTANGNCITSNVNIEPVPGDNDEYRAIGNGTAYGTHTLGSFVVMGMRL